MRGECAIVSKKYKIGSILLNVMVCVRCIVSCSYYWGRAMNNYFNFLSKYHDIIMKVGRWEAISFINCKILKHAFLFCLVIIILKNHWAKIFFLHSSKFEYFVAAKRDSKLKFLKNSFFYLVYISWHFQFPWNN